MKEIVAKVFKLFFSKLKKMVNFLNFVTFNFSWTPDMQCGALLRASLAVLFSAYLTL